MINRSARRVRMSCRLIFVGIGNIQGEAQTIDLSASGCRAFCDTPPSIGTKLKVAVYLRGRAQPLQIEWARVQWVRHTMIGLRFCYVQRKHLAQLRHIPFECALWELVS